MKADIQLSCMHPVRFCERFIHKEDSEMNDDQIKGKAKDIGGKVQEEVGKVTGSSEQQAKGLSKQVEGKVQEKAGDLRDAINKGNR
jgi:uncharacterized protein YjbJ (UPF0337 family)